MTGGVRIGATLAVGGLMMAAGCGGDGGPSQSFMSLGTAGTGGIYYPLGGALAGRLSLADSLHQYTAEVTGGSVENINRIREGQMDLAFALAITIYEAYNGGLDYPEAVSDLRIVGPLYPNLTHVLVPRDSEAHTIDDLAGARISVGSAGSGTEQISRQLLEAHGLTYDDVQVRYLTFTESSAALRDGAIDAALISVGYPAAAVLEATTTGGARLLPIQPDKIASLRERYPYYLPGRIPAGVYPGIDEDLSTVAVLNWIIGSVHLEDEVVTHLLDILRDDRVSLQRVHDMTAQIDLGMLNRAPIPLHPAVERWLAESSSDVLPGPP